MKRFLTAACLFFFGLASQADYLYYEEPDPSPFLADIGSPPPCDYTISQNSDWAQINNAAYRVICVAPGDYSSAGIKTLTADGTAAAPRWLRYFSPEVPTAHPWFMTSAQRAKLPPLKLDQANYWVFHRLYWYPPAFGFTYNAVESINSDNNVYDSLYFERITASGIRLSKGSDYNTIQYCVGKNSSGDGAMVNFNTWGVNASSVVSPPATQVPVIFNRMVSNECIDVNDCAHFSGMPPSNPSYPNITEEDYRGTVIYNNDFYNTSAVYSLWDGTYDPSGGFGYREDGTDLKSGSPDALNPVLYAHNRSWGFRPENSVVGSPARTSVYQTHIVVQYNVENVLIEGNIFHGAGFSLGGYDYINFYVKNNLFHTIDQLNTETLTYIPSLSLVAGTHSATEFSGNVFSSILNLANYNTLAWSGDILVDPTTVFSDNVWINTYRNSAGTTFGGTVSGNKYYNAVKPVWDTTTVVDESTVTGSGWDNQFCTTRKRLTAPETWCLDNALYVSGEPAIVPPPRLFNPVDLWQEH